MISEADTLPSASPQRDPLEPTESAMRRLGDDTMRLGDRREAHPPPRGRVTLRQQNYFSGEKAAGTTSMFSCTSVWPGVPPRGGQMPSLRAFSRISARWLASL